MSASLAPVKPMIVDRIVRWGECDFAGIAYTPRYADWCVEAIEDVYGRLGVPWRQLHDLYGMGSPFVRLAIDFKSPVQLDDALALDVSVTKVGTTSIQWQVHGRVEERTVFIAELVNVIINKATGSPCPLPQHLRAALAMHGN